MNYHYTSHWKLKKALTFRLSGVIAAGGANEAGAYCPEDREAQEEWDELLGKGFGRGVTPVLWLRRITERGNGITEEFDTIRPISAASLREALLNAYQATVKEYTGEMTLYEEGSSADPSNASETLSDPFAGLLPDPPAPSESNQTITGKLQADGF